MSWIRKLMDLALIGSGFASLAVIRKLLYGMVIFLALVIVGSLLGLGVLAGILYLAFLAMVSHGVPPATASLIIFAVITLLFLATVWCAQTRLRRLERLAETGLAMVQPSLSGRLASLFESFVAGLCPETRK